METVGSMDVFLTANQRNWMNALKSAASKKPKKRITKPKVTYNFVNVHVCVVFIVVVVDVVVVVVIIVLRYYFGALSSF
jgi:hypothetical protein